MEEKIRKRCISVVPVVYGSLFKCDFEFSFINIISVRKKYSGPFNKGKQNSSRARTDKITNFKLL